MCIRKKRKRIAVQWVGVLGNLRLKMAIVTVSMNSASSIGVPVGNSGIALVPMI